MVPVQPSQGKSSLVQPNQGALQKKIIFPKSGISPTDLALTLMLTFKSLVINDVALWKSLLTSVLTFKSLAINDVALVDLYMRYTPFATFAMLHVVPHGSTH
jgi:hypothetical protein